MAQSTSLKLDFYTRKLAYIWLKVTEYTVHAIVWVYSLIYQRKRKGAIQSIGAYWHHPTDLTGSNLRMGAWKPYFEADGIAYTNFHINSLKEYVAHVEKGTWTQRYAFFAKCLWRRLPQILQAHRYDTVWVDTGIIPYYPRKTAFIERCMKRVVRKLVVDTTDGGDYQKNPNLMMDILRQSAGITVGYLHQKTFYEAWFDVTQVYWTIPTSNYIVKTDYQLASIPVIGWMGSPSNFSNVIPIIPALKALARTHQFVFRYVCRESFDDLLEGLNVDHRVYGDDYYEILASFDIGISPFLKNDFRSKGKIAMKHQEFLLMGTPQVCSNNAISEFVEHKLHVLIADLDTESWSNHIASLLDDESLRVQLGQNAKKLFEAYYTYELQYDTLKKALTSI